MSNLRLIVSEKSDEPSGQRLIDTETILPPSIGEQLEFSFIDRAENRIVIVPMDRLHGTDLYELLAKLKPKTVVDLRNVLRFDIPGTNRSEFFQMLGLYRSRYIRIQFAWTSFKPSGDLVEDPFVKNNVAEVFSPHNSPLLVAAAKEHEVRLFGSWIGRALAKGGQMGWRVIQFA